MSNANEDRKQLVYPAEQVLDKDLVDLRNQASETRRRIYNELSENKNEYEWEFYPENQEVIDERRKELDLTTLEAAKLMLATAIEEADRSAPEEQAFVDQFEAQEREFVRDFDDFRRKFNNVSRSQLEDNIKNRDGEVYEFVEEELRRQTEMRSTLLNTQANEIRGSVISHFQDEFEEFFELANEAVFLYIKHHGLPNTIEEVVHAAEVAADASSEREQIANQIERKIDELAESVHHGLRDQERALRSELTNMRAEISSGGDTDALERELADIREDIKTVATQQQQDIQAISDQLEDFETLESELEAKIGELKEAQQRALSDLQDETQEQATDLIKEEIERMEHQKDELAQEVNRLRNERERIETTGERLDREYSSLEERLEATEKRVDETQTDLEQQLDELSESIPTEPSETDGKVIRAEMARLYEQDFIGRFDTSVREAETITLPDGSALEVPEGYWTDKRRSQSGNQRPIVEDTLGDAEDIGNYPLGAYSIYRVVQTRFGGLTSSTELVIEAVVKANLKAFVNNGFDAQPAGVDDLLDIVNETLAWSEMEDTPHLIGIASPTGWTDEVENLVQNEEFARTRFSRDVSICLLDIQDDNLIYDTNDSLMRENIALFEREVNDERVMKCIDTVQNEYIDDPVENFVPLYEVVDNHGFHPHVVRKSFKHFVDEGLAQEQYREELQGLCLFIDRS